MLDERDVEIAIGGSANRVARGIADNVSSCGREGSGVEVVGRTAQSGRKRRVARDVWALG